MQITRHTGIKGNSDFECKFKIPTPTVKTGNISFF